MCDMTCKSTRLISANDDLSVCADIIKAGGLVAFPTETVYGLGADGMNESAVKSIFDAKGRPHDNPLILHVSGVEMAEQLLCDIPSVFYELTELFWPGPLTIICKKSNAVIDAVSAGLDTVAVRMPDNDVALKLISLANTPIAAPSANLSGKPSPTCAEHVYQDMNGRIDAIIDGGECRVGVESTVISITDGIEILRPGDVTAEMLECATKTHVRLSDSILTPPKPGEKVKSPGMKYKHYAPDAQVIAFSGSDDEMTSKINDTYDSMSEKRCIIFCGEENKERYGNRQKQVLGSRKDARSFCRNLFAALRECNDLDMVLCETLDTDGAGLAYMNRLLRACGFNIV